uniref:Uncharacterized protein n=1 Tax=Caenorhabditis tropicalis TaxID=1561998 RepID=A0A1I7UJA6_9PELO
MIILCLLLLLALPSEATDHFYMHGYFDCALDLFRYHMVIWERDYWDWDDPLSHYAPRYSRAPHYFEINFEANGDQQWSTGYDLYARIIHDCNTTNIGKHHLLLNVELGHYRMGANYTIQTVIPVTDKGEQTTEIIGRRLV